MVLYPFFKYEVNISISVVRHQQTHCRNSTSTLKLESLTNLVIIILVKEKPCTQRSWNH